MTAAASDLFFVWVVVELEPDVSSQSFLWTGGDFVLCSTS